MWLQRKAKKALAGGAGMKMPDLATERDTMLDSFHAIGKFLYNKREASYSQVLLHPMLAIKQTLLIHALVSLLGRSLLTDSPSTFHRCSRANWVKIFLFPGDWAGTHPRKQTEHLRKGNPSMSHPGMQPFCSLIVAEDIHFLLLEHSHSA